MSIRDEWVQHVADGRLFKLGYSLPGLPEKRTVLMADEVRQLVEGPWPETLMGDRCARLRANLEFFLEGTAITVCWQPFKANDYHQLGRIHPVEEGIWDLRSVDPSPGLRLFFCLAEKDVMIAFICAPRSIPVPWLERLPLGARNNKAWKRARAECKRQWRHLFPAYLPLVSEKPDECISFAIIE